MSVPDWKVAIAPSHFLFANFSTSIEWTERTPSTTEHPPVRFKNGFVLLDVQMPKLGVEQAIAGLFTLGRRSAMRVEVQKNCRDAEKWGRLVGPRRSLLSGWMSDVTLELTETIDGGNKSTRTWLSRKGRDLMAPPRASAPMRRLTSSVTQLNTLPWLHWNTQHSPFPCCCCCRRRRCCCCRCCCRRWCCCCCCCFCCCCCCCCLLPAPVRFHPARVFRAVALLHYVRYDTFSGLTCGHYRRWCAVGTAPADTNTWPSLISSENSAYLPPADLHFDVTCSKATCWSLALTFQHLIGVHATPSSKMLIVVAGW